MSLELAEPVQAGYGLGRRARLWLTRGDDADIIRAVGACTGIEAADARVTSDLGTLSSVTTPVLDTVRPLGLITRRARRGDTDMGHRFAEIAFTPNVKAAQEQNGSRRSNTRFEGGEPLRHRLGDREAQFIAARDSFYMATVSETGWPYIQHRGGPAGFLRVLDEKTIGFADLNGNRQYISIGNLAGNDRVSLFLMDYANRARLKILGRARVVPPDDAETMARLAVDGVDARVERGILIGIEAFDWNCSQHITERYTLSDVETATAALRARIAELEAELRQARRS